jgi:ribosome-associated heat shock protein Hsp15
MVGPRLIDLTIEGLGERRGPAEEARALYALIEAD